MGLNKGLETPPGFQPALGPKGRTVYNPNDYVRKVHAELSKSIGKVRLPDIHSSVGKHLKNRFIYKVDLAEAFNTVRQIDIELMLDIGFEHFDGDGRYFFHAKNGGLIQGAPCSTSLFHLYCKEVIDGPLKAYASRHNMVFTRYCDDMLFSSRSRITRKIRRPICRIIRREGLKINEGKTQVVDTAYNSVQTLGMVIQNGKVSLTEDFLERFAKTEEGSRSYVGQVAWRNAVLALNQTRRV